MRNTFVFLAWMYFLFFKLYPTCVHSTAAEEQINTSPPDGEKNLENISQTQKDQ